MNWRDELEVILKRAEDAELPDLAGELARAQALVALRLQRQNGGLLHRGEDPESRRGENPQQDRLLTVDEAADVLGVKTGWLYRHADRLPFTRKLSPKMLRFSELGLRRYLGALRR